ncbi:MAG: BrnA antitoxin family protein [Magnetococcus sp. THC-1_WYH]
MILGIMEKRGLSPQGWFVCMSWLSSTLRGKAISVSYLPEKRPKMSKNPILHKSQTDWDRLDSMSDEEIDFSDSPEISPEAFAQGIVRQGLKPISKKKLLNMRVDGDVLDWFKSQGKGYQTKINAILKAYRDAHVESLR